MTTLRPDLADPGPVATRPHDRRPTDSGRAGRSPAGPVPSGPGPVDPALPPIPQACPIPRVRCLRGGAPRRPRPLPPPAPVAPAPYDGAEARRAIAATVRAALEVLDGRRPAAHIGPAFDASALRYWRAERGRAERVTPSRLLRLRLDLPRPDAAEVAAVCAIDGRVRALAARFERRKEVWCCASVRLI